MGRFVLPMESASAHFDGRRMDGFASQRELAARTPIRRGLDFRDDRQRYGLGDVSTKIESHWRVNAAWNLKGKIGEQGFGSRAWPEQPEIPGATGNDEREQASIQRVVVRHQDDGSARVDVDPS